MQDIITLEDSVRPSAERTYDITPGSAGQTTQGLDVTTGDFDLFGLQHAAQDVLVTVQGAGHGPYVYNGFGQLASAGDGGRPASAIHMVYDQDGNLIAEANAVTGETMREYIWSKAGPSR